MYKFSRYKMYKTLELLLQDISLDTCFFVGEDEYSCSSIKQMLSPKTQIEVSGYPEVDVMNMSKPDNSVECLVADQVLEHVLNPFEAVNEIYRVLIPGGLAIVTTCLMNPVHYASNNDQARGHAEDYWRFTPNGLRLLFDKYTEILQCNGHGDFKFLHNCMAGYRDKIVDPGSSLEKLAVGDDGKTYLHVWIVARK
ncbi:hypothetical protein CL622_03645 [archaeon]|nr:hypothetical protein [archaeon]